MGSACDQFPQTSLFSAVTLSELNQSNLKQPEIIIFFYQSFIFEIRIWQTVFELEFVNLLYIQWYLIINISYSFDYYGLSLLP